MLERERLNECSVPACPLYLPSHVQVLQSATKHAQMYECSEREPGTYLYYI